MARGAGEAGPGGAGTAPAPPPASAGRPSVLGFVAELSRLDGSGLSDRARVDLVAELERVKGAVAAAQARLTHALRVSREALTPQDAVRSVGSEVALARRCSPSLGDRFVGLARALVTEMPATHRALTAGVCTERHAVGVAQATAALSLADRAEVDRRVGPLLGRLGVKAADRAARRVAAELDAAAVVRRMEEAVRSRRVTVRPAPDGMAYLTVLGPMVEVVGAHAALLARGKAVVAGQCPDELPEGRAVGAVCADTALRLMSGRMAQGQVQPVEVHLVMTDRALLGTGDPSRPVDEPARIPGHGSLPAPVARRWLLAGEGAVRPGWGGAHDSSSTGHGPGTAGFGVGRGGGDSAGTGVGGEGTALPAGGGAASVDVDAAVWLRRLYTTPDGRDLVAMDSRRRVFTGLLRRMLILRDDVCTTPWCESLVAHADHADPARGGGATSFVNGRGTCARCNHVKEAPGWSAAVSHTEGGGAGSDGVGRVVVVRTPSGHVLGAQPPPVLGWGSETSTGSSCPDERSVPTDDASGAVRGPAEPRTGTQHGLQGGTDGSAAGRPRAMRPSHRSPRRRPVRRSRRTEPATLTRPAKRPRMSSRLELELCRLLR